MTNTMNTMACAVKREAWTWYLPSNLAVAKNLGSRCEHVLSLFFVFAIIGIAK